MIGTVGYLAPEHISGEPIDWRADMFALGLLLYEMVAGKQPFVRSTTVETLAAVIKDDPPDLPEDLPIGLRRLISHCLEENRRTDSKAPTMCGSH